MKFELLKTRVVFLLLMLLPLSVMADDIDNAIKVNSWKYEATIYRNNVWDVREEIDVTFLEPRHGIYRYVPRYFVIMNNVNGGIAQYDYRSEIDNVYVDGYTIQLKDNDDGQDNLIIRIGDEDRLVEGTHKYVISYQISVPDDRYPSSDFIYASVLGADWKSVIDKFEFVLHFDKPLPEGIAQSLRVFSGEWGNIGNDLHIDVKVNKNTIMGSAVDIKPFNAITIRVEIEDGYWEDAASVSKGRMYLFACLVVLLLLFIFYFLIKNRKRKPLMVIEYSAPDGISSAEVGVIIDNTADLSDLTSLIVWFASKGYLKIREIEGEKHLLRKDEIDVELTKLKDLPEDAPEYQKKFWDVFFKNEDSVILSKLGDKHKLISDSLLALQNHFSGGRSLQSVNMKCVFAILAFYVCGVVFLGACSSVSSFDGSLMFGALLWAIPAFITFIFRLAASNYDMIASWKKMFIQYVIIIVLGALDTLLFYSFFYNENNTFLSFEYMGGVIIMGWVIALLAARVQHDTKYRLEKMSLLLGFRESIEKSELPMLKAQVDENPSYFFEILPYAMVFGLTDKWVKKFKEIDIENPTWYEGSSSLSSYALANHMSHAVSSQISHAINVSSHDTTPGSSSSRGGFSGGGVGGGGGGSW